jgi:hypothetical protein
MLRLTSLVTSILLATGVAAAEPPPQRDSDGYRSTLMWTDGASVAAMVGGLAGAFTFEQNDSAQNLSLGIAAAGLATWIAGGSVLHAREGENGRAAASLALRVGTPLAGAFAGTFAFSRSSSCGHEDCELDALFLGGSLGLIIGGVVGTAVDQFVLAEGSKGQVTFTLTPTMNNDRGGVAGIGGTF